MTCERERHGRRWFLRAAGAGVGGALLHARAGAPTAAPHGGAGRTLHAGPDDYLARLATLRPGDTLVLAPGRYGVDAAGRDTAAPPGLPLFGLHGTPTAPITITGPAAGPRPVFLGRSTHNTIRLADASHLVIRGLEVDGRDRGGFGVGTHGPTHHVTLEDNRFHGMGSDQQVVAIAAIGHPTWGWIVRRNVVEGAGTGLYLGNSNGDSPFVDGLVEHNLVRDTLGYCLQVKHQVPWARVPAGMPTGPTTTVIRHNVFVKSGRSATGAAARPSLLLGDQPPEGPGAGNGFAVYGNLFFGNPVESLLQAEGRAAVYANLMVTSGDAVRVQRHNGVVRDVRIFHNTVVAGGAGIVVGGGAAGFTQRVVANAVFADGVAIAVAGAAATAADNLTGTRAAAADHLVAPLAGLPGLDLYPRPGRLDPGPARLDGLDVDPDAGRDFNGTPRDPAFRGAYSGAGVNPGWRLATARKP